jgi:hypothetical protein
MAVNIEAIVAEFRDVRADLDAARKGYKEFERKSKDRLAELAMQLREIADEMGVNSFSTAAGTAYRVTTESFRVGNWDEILNYIQTTGHWNMLEKRIAKLATKEIYEADGVLPPGVEYEVEVDFVVRKS